jgi:drug/metabolite transporter (DMT)-like permease
VQVSILLSLITAAAFGTGDFFGGMSAKRMSVLRVVAGSHLIGLIGVFIAAVLIDNTFIASEFALGALGGAFGGLGVGLLYRGLSRGPMSVVAPLTAVTSAAVPALWGILTGERFSTIGWAGLALAFVAIWLTSTSSDGTQAPVTVQVVAEALLAGAGFGMLFIVLDMTDDSGAPWPIVGARLLTSTVLIGWLLWHRQPVFAKDRAGFGLVALTGLFDTGSNVLFLYALQVADLTVVSVLSSLYPIATVLLARTILDERMNRWQLIGFVVALTATAMIATG